MTKFRTHLFERIQRGARTVANPDSSTANQFFGRTTISDGSASAVASTSLVASDSIVLFSISAPSSASNTVIVVRSINAGNSITFGTADGSNVTGDQVVMWELVNPTLT